MKASALFALLPSAAMGLSLYGSPPVAPTKTLDRRDTWGGAVSLGPTRSRITKAVTTILPGPAPPTQNGVLFLWPGMSNGTGHLVQTTLESWADNSWCGAATGEWCIRCSLFGWFGQLDGPASPVPGSMSVEILYELQSDGTTWKQTAKDVATGKQLSTFSYDSGPYMTGYGTGTECNDGCTGTIAAQTYSNTVITLAEADATFGNTIATSGGATYSGLASNDKKVWTIQRMNIPAMI